MIVKKILGKASDFAGKNIINVDLPPEDRLKKLLRLKADDGMEFGIDFDDYVLHQADVLACIDDKVYAINCLAQDLLKITPNSLAQMGFIAHSIGNRHLPAHFEDDAMYVENDYLIKEWLEQNGFSFSQVQKVLAHPLKHASHSH